jgi:hypothetical protein
MSGNETYGLRHQQPHLPCQDDSALGIIIFNQLKPSSLSHIQLGLGEDIFEAFMVNIDIANIAQQIVPPGF